MNHDNKDPSFHNTKPHSERLPSAEPSHVTPLPYIRKKRTPWLSLGVLIGCLALITFGVVYAFIYKDKILVAQSTPAPNTDQATLPPLSTLTGNDLTNDNLTGDNPAQNSAQNDAHTNNTLSNDTNDNLANNLGLPSLNHPPLGEVASSADRNKANANKTNASPNEPSHNQAPIIPDNQRVGTAPVAPVQTPPSGQPPAEQASSDPSINRQTTDGRALIAAIDEADKENDALREHIERARQLNDRKIAQARGQANPPPAQADNNSRPHLTRAEDTVQLTQDDIPSGTTSNSETTGTPE